MTQESSFLVEKEQQTLTIKINRPQVYNALDRQSKHELTQLFEATAGDRSIRTIVLTGEGKAFCTGQDLNDRTIQGDQKIDLGHTLQTEWIPLVESIRRCPQIVIASLGGVAAGAGVSVALACDFIIASENARIVSGFAKIGLVPDAGSTFHLTRTLGPKKAMELFLLNEPLEAPELLRLNLINQIGPDPLKLSLELANKINSLPPLSAQMIKKNVQQAAELGYNESMDNEVSAQTFLGATEDYQEGLRAFFEKRTPQFKGC